MQTSREWWDSIKTSPEKLTDWLQKQFHGEATAAPRIRELAIKFAPNNQEASRIFNLIADQEETHASWIAELCRNRGISPRILEKKERYWDETLSAIEELGTLEYASGVAAHAEQMRLERIRAIAEDSDSNAPIDIRETFSKILPQEEFHASAFERFATEVGMQQSAENHLKGMEALGLVV